MAIAGKVSEATRTWVYCEHSQKMDRVCEKCYESENSRLEEALEAIFQICENAKEKNIGQFIGVERIAWRALNNG